MTADPEHATDAVACTRLAYAFGDAKAVDGLDLTVREGEVFGHDAAGDRMAVRRLLGYVPQQLSADSGLTGRENVSLFARVFDVPRHERAERVGQALGVLSRDVGDTRAGCLNR